MAKVPTYDNFQATPNTLPQTQLQNPQAQNFAADQAQRTGQALSGVGQQLAAVVTKAQEQANQIRVDDALNRAKEEALRLTYDKDTGYTNLRGINALERPDGKPLADEYGENLAKHMATAASGLGNDAQRAAFAKASSGMLTNFRGQLLKHESDEFKTYALSVSEGVQATALREVALSWDNPEAIDNAVKRIRAHTYQQGQLLGKSAEWQEAQVRGMVSTAHKLALTAALENNNPMYADSYLKKYSGQMEAGDILQVRGKITATIDLQVGDNVGADVVAGYAADIAPSDFGRLRNIVMGIESGGRRYAANGKILEGPATKYGTAKGEMQVLDGTNKNPGYGVKPAQDDSPEERARVGEDYLAAMIKEYDGNLAQALAAYNWGPGNVDKAIKKHGLDWLPNAPKETRDYVVRALNRYGSGAGATTKPTLLEMKADLRQRPELADNPARLKHAEARVESDFKTMNEHQKQRDEEATSAALDELAANGGDFAGLSPAVRMAIPSDKVSSAMNFADQVAKRRHDPKAWAEILSLPTEDLANMKPSEFYMRFMPVLDDAHLEKGYALLKSAQGDPDAKHLEVITISNRMKQAAIQAGIIPGKGAPDEDQTKAFGEFAQMVDGRVRQFESIDLQSKRKANSEELQKIIDTVLMDKAFVPRWYWFDKEEMLSQIDPADQAKAYVTVGKEDIPIASIPVDQRMTITTKLQSRGLPITEQAIAELWVRAGKPK